VQLHEIERLNLQIFEAALDPGVEVFTGIALRDLLGQPPTRFGDDVEWIAGALFAQPGDQAFAVSVSIDIGGVDQVDAEIERLMHGCQ